MTVLSPLSLASLHAMQYEVSASVPCREAVSLKIVGMIHPSSVGLDFHDINLSDVTKGIKICNRR
jgi:hypothetical protein